MNAPSGPSHLQTLAPGHLIASSGATSLLIGVIPYVNEDGRAGEVRHWLVVYADTGAVKFLTDSYFRAADGTERIDRV